MKQILSIVCCLLLATQALPNGGPRKDSYRIKTIVIDPGHGGHDTGCLGSSAREKNVALDIALKLGKYIEQNYPDIKVIFTRKTDVFIPLHERANIANKAKADLFICIHLNSGNKVAYGAETYVMGLHKTEDNLNVAKRENASILLEEDYKKQYDGFDPNSPEANIIFSLYQNQFMHQSLSFASKVQDQFEEYAGRYNRGIKQAGFLVLYRTAMPAVLIECGFLTHDLEEHFLDSDRGQTTIATSIFRAFKEYKTDMESGSPSNDEPAPSRSEDAPKQSSVQQPVAKTPDAIVLKKDSDDTAPKHNDEPVKEPKSVASTTPEKTAVDSTPAPKPTPKPKSVAVSAPEKPAADSTPAPSPKPKPVVAETQASTVFLCVQIGATTNPEKDKDAFAKVAQVKAIKGQDGYTRFVSGHFTSPEQARKRLAELKQQGYKDAFLSAYNGEQKISVSEAEQLLKRR